MARLPPIPSDWNKQRQLPPRCHAGGSAKALYEEKRLFAAAGEARPERQFEAGRHPRQRELPVTGVDGFGAKPRPKLIGSRPSARLARASRLGIEKVFVVDKGSLRFFCCC